MPASDFFIRGHVDLEDRPGEASPLGVTRPHGSGGSAVITFALALVVGATVLWRFEIAGRREASLMLVLLTALADSMLYQGVESSNGTIFKLDAPFGSLNLSTLLLACALVCRFLANLRQPGRTNVRMPALLWAAFLLWTLVGFIQGYSYHRPLNELAFQAIVIVHIGGAALLAAGVGADALVRRTLPRLVYISVVLATACLILTQLGVSFSVNLPLVPLSSVGVIGSDGATTLATLGAVGIALGLAAEQHRSRLLVSGVVLICVPLLGAQRAAFLGSVTSFAILGLGLLVGRGGRLRLRSIEVVVLLLALVGAGALSVASNAESGTSAITSPVTSKFDRPAKQQSSQSRINQWAEARRVIKTQWLMGGGLGQSYSYYEVGARAIIQSQITHDVALDVLLRSGVIGLVLILAALFATLRESITQWRSRDPGVAALSLGATAAIGSLLTKAAVESVFEKHRLALLLGIMIGLAYAAGTKARQGAGAPIESAPETSSTPAVVPARVSVGR